MLYFECRGEYFKVDEDSNMTQKSNSDFSGQWKFLGVSFHHWRNGIDISYSEKTLPENLIGGLVWDLDHGTTRQWGGRYMGEVAQNNSSLGGVDKPQKFSRKGGKLWR